MHVGLGIGLAIVGPIADPLIDGS